MNQQSCLQKMGEKVLNDIVLSIFRPFYWNNQCFIITVCFKTILPFSSTLR